MKASLKLRDDEAGPLLRAKLLVVLLCARRRLASDPADLRLSYASNRPTGARASPLSLSLILGSGPGGSPSPSGASAVTMAVEVSAAGVVSFSLVLKPSLGDFAVRKRFESAAGGGGASASEVTMRSVMPVRGGAATVRVQWGVRIPAEVTTGGEASAAGLTLRRLPFLVLGKVIVERRPEKPAPAAKRAAQEEAAVEKVRKEVEELRPTAGDRREETAVVAGACRSGAGRLPEIAVGRQAESWPSVRLSRPGISWFLFLLGCVGQYTYYIPVVPVCAYTVQYIRRWKWQLYAQAMERIN